MKKSKELRCVHRHTIEEHPKCFTKGLVKWANEKIFVKETKNAWYNYPEYRIGYLDIEVSNLDADYGDILSWCIKEKDGNVIYDVITKEELFSGQGDKRIVKSLLEELSRYKIIVTYYGTGFDIPYARSRALYYDLEFPSYGNLYHFDLYYTVKAKMKLSRNSLKNVTHFLGIDGKTDLDADTWKRARYGDREALDELLKHNIYDVEILESLHNKLEFSAKWTRRSL